MSAPAVTTYMETAALWHVLNEDYAEARRIAEEMLPHERREFADQLAKLRSILGAECPTCRQITPATQMVLKYPLDPARRREVCKSCDA